MKRLLCIVGQMGAGGAETFLMKVYRNIDKSRFQMDFCVSSSEKGVYEEEIVSMGGKVFRITPKTKSFKKNFVSIARIVNRNNYKYVMRVSQHSLSCMELLAAKMGGAKKLVFRSSNSNSCGGHVNSIIHNIFKFLTIKLPDVKIAPSTEAAEFMFGKQCVKKGEVLLLKNGLNIDEYGFSDTDRNRKRKELGINNEKVIGHVGRFSKQKNHYFIISVFNEVVKKDPNTKLILIGTGELEDEIKDVVNRVGLNDKVMFLENRNDVPQLMSAMDILLFPSLFEGMPNVVIEAQASGLHCIISDTITKEADVTGLVEYMSLENSAEEWAEHCVALLYNNTNRSDIKKELKKAGYDINDVVKIFAENVFEE